MNKELTKLQKRIGYTFKQGTLLELAVTHPSVLNENPDITESNQRLEFLGDAVLQLIISEEIYRLYPQERELVEGRFTAKLGHELGLESCLRVQTDASELASSNSALEDAFEALVAALYLDSGYNQAREVVLKIYGDIALRLAAILPDDNPKGRLQELLQPEHGNKALRYEVINTSGEAHAREFEVTVFFKDQPLASGHGTSKKLAEEAAADAALVNWNTTPAS
jgi:ribonuclease III